MTANAAEAAPLTRAEKSALLAGAGFVGLLVGNVAGINQLTLAGAAAVAIGAVMGMSAGWFIGLTPRPAAAPASLVGMRIGFGGHRFTVLDDSAVRGDGRRASVVAADEAGQLGLLFIGFDAEGAVAEARIGDGPWGAAQVVG